MPMPPWSWIDCWPTNFADLPICTFAAATAVARSLASSKSQAIVANIDIERACSTATNMSAARCCKVWKLPIATPNCLRVFRYSTVVFSDSSIAQRGAGFIDHARDQRQCVVGIADRGIGADLDAGEGDVGGMQAVLGRIALP